MASLIGLSGLGSTHKWAGRASLLGRNELHEITLFVYVRLLK